MVLSIFFCFFVVVCNYSNGCYSVDKQKCQVAKTTEQIYVEFQ